jgi:hypothetical protein
LTSSCQRIPSVYRSNTRGKMDKCRVSASQRVRCRALWVNPRGGVEAEGSAPRREFLPLGHHRLEWQARTGRRGSRFSF